MAEEHKTERLHMLISPSEIAAIDDWGFKRRIRTKAESVRRLCQIGLSYDREGRRLIERSRRALTATMAAFDQTDVDVGKMPKRLRAALAVSIAEQLEAYRAAAAALIASGVLDEGKAGDKIDELAKVANGYVQLLQGEERDDAR